MEKRISRETMSECTIWKVEEKLALIIENVDVNL
jgi:hypothetical protein